MGFCQGIISSLKSLFYSLEAFIGGLGKDPNHLIPLFRPHIPKYQLNANLRMLDLYMNWKPEFRNDTVLNINEKEIKTGDFIAISRFDCLDNIIMIGTGSHIGHWLLLLGLMENYLFLKVKINDIGLKWDSKNKME